MNRFREAWKQGCADGMIMPVLVALREAADELDFEQGVTATALAALTAIANADFRGNRSQEQTIAWQTLEEIEKMRGQS